MTGDRIRSAVDGPRRRGPTTQRPPQVWCVVQWEREEVRRLDLPLLNDARCGLRDGVQLARGLRFTAREIGLLRLMEQSATAVEIAEQLYLSVNTVKWHKANIYRKLVSAAAASPSNGPVNSA